MFITIERLEAKLRELAQQAEQAGANYFSLLGAKINIEALIKEAREVPIQNVDTSHSIDANTENQGEHI